MAARIRIACDASALAPVLADLKALLEPSPQPGSQLRELVLDLLDDPEQLVRFDIDRSAASAGELRVALQPSNRLLDLVAALRAGNWDLHGVQHGV